LANGDSILAIPPISRFPDCFALRGKKAKKGEKHEEKVRRANTEKLEEK